MPAVGRKILVGSLALIGAAIAVRAAFVDAYAKVSPELAAWAWDSHPDVALSAGFAEIGRAASFGLDPSAGALKKVVDAAGKDPLAVEPFLVRGVQRQLAGDLITAEHAFREAKRRDPRSPAARYFLAELYLRTGRPGDSLQEIAALPRLTSAGGSVAPFLAQYARAPNAARQLHHVLQNQPALRPAILAELAKDAKNTDLILALGRGARSIQDQGWQTRLVEALVAEGQISKAKSVWSQFTGASLTAGVFDGAFGGASATPPFGWSFPSGAGGLAEPENGVLHVIYYGRETATLASQLLTLKPGPHRMFTRASGSSDAGALAWRIRCSPSDTELGELPISAGERTTLVIVPRNCAAQRLELIGIPQDVPREVDLYISEIAIFPREHP